MRLPAPVLSWVETVTGHPAAVIAHYDNATTASVFGLRLASGAELVLKRYDIDDPYDRRHERCAHEAAVLDLLSGGSVPAPRRVAIDPDGAATGAPSLLMSLVSGSSVLPGNWQERLVALIVAIHNVDPGLMDWSYEPYWAGFELEIPPWASDQGLWQDVLEAIVADPPETSRGFVHRDLHAGNVLWNGGKIVGALDWMQACIGPQALDLSHCRANLVMDHGIEVGEEFLASYLKVAPPGVWHPFWDLVDAVDFIPYLLGPDAVARWRWDGRPAEVTRAYFEQYLRSALVALDEIG